MKEQWKNKNSDALFNAILTLKSVTECESFFRDILTLKELEDMILRFKIARMLNTPKHKPYLEIAKELKTSTTTVTRVARWLNTGEGGYTLALARLNK